MYDSFGSSLTTSKPTINVSSHVPELTDAFTRQQINSISGQSQYVQQPLQQQANNEQNVNTKNLLVDNIAARWASPDGDNSEPRIITEPLKSFTHQNHATAAVAASAARNGLVMTGMPMEPLTLECDPHAWDLKPDDIEFQKLIGNLRKLFLII